MIESREAARRLKERLLRLERRTRPPPGFAPVLEMGPFSKRAAELEHFRARLRQLLPAALEAVRSVGAWDQPLLDLETDPNLYEDSVMDAVAELDRALGPSQPQIVAAKNPVLECTLEQTGPESVVVREGGTVVTVRGPKRVWLLKKVVQAGRTLTWKELVTAEIANAEGILLRRQALRSSSSRSVGTPKIATSCATLQDRGRRIRNDLGKLNYHWQQDGTGVVWSADCK